MKVTGSHIHWKSGNISETVLDRDVTTGDTRMANLIAANVMILSVLEGHSILQALFKCDILYLWHVAWSCASAELLLELSASGEQPLKRRWYWWWYIY